jgi:hypothetical protein
MGFTFTDVTYAVNEYTKQEGTFSNISSISWRPVLVVEKAGLPRENHRP